MTLRRCQKRDASARIRASGHPDQTAYRRDAGRVGTVREQDDDLPEQSRRLAWLATVVFLDINDHEPDLDDESVHDPHGAGMAPKNYAEMLIGHREGREASYASSS